VSVARIAVPDFVSNSYFPAVAAIERGFFTREGLDVAHELIFPNYKAYEAIRDGKIDLLQVRRTLPFAPSRIGREQSC
jgi:ABC-type nitrate/sulfonate/bicarbonate transport system substrate-binding protein